MIRAAVAALMLAAAAPAPLPVPPPGRVRLDRTTILIRGGFLAGRQPDGNSVVMAGPRGAIVFDTGRHPIHTATISEAIRALHQPLVVIVNSHWHLDHVSGNPALKSTNPRAIVYASDAIDGALTGFLKRSAGGASAALAKGDLSPETAEDVRADLATVASGARLRPDVVIDRNRGLAPGGRILSIRLARHAATAGDVWIVDAARRRVLAGDLVTLPAPFFDTACPDGWRAALAEIAATPFRELVPGHGPAMTRADFGRYRAAFGRFVECAEGRSTTDVCARAWRSDAATLISVADADRATRMAAYYIDLIRGGTLRQYCA